MTPEIDLHIKGECRAGATFHTALNPMIPASPRVVVRFMKAGPVNLPSVRAVAIPPDVIAVELRAFCHGVASIIFFSSWIAYG